MADPVTIGVDATFMARDRRGMGRCIRSILHEWKSACPHRLHLLTREKRHLAELSDWVEAGWSCHEAAKSPPLDVCWFPWNRVDWDVDCPVIVTIYDTAPYSDYHPKTRHLEADRQRLVEAADKADRLITTSSFSRTELHRHLQVELSLVDVVPLGLDPAFHPHRNEYQDPFFAEKIGDEPYILFVGSPEPRKNLEGLLEAFGLLEAQIPHALVLVSQKPSSPGLADRLRGRMDPILERCHGLSERIIWVSEVEDETLAELYRRSQVFVMPSFYEGFGLPVLEAMGCGATVAAARAASLPEVGGEVPHWFNPEDPVDIARAIMDALEHPNGDQGVERAAQFRWSTTAAQILEILEGAARHGISVRTP